MWRLTLSKATRVKPLRGLTSALQDSGKLTVLHNIELHVLYRYCNRRQAYMEDAYIEGTVCWVFDIHSSDSMVRC